MERLDFLPGVLRALNAKVGRALNDQDLEDVAQEVRVVLWHKRHEYDPAQSLEGWVYRIAFNLLMNRLRKGQRAQQAMSRAKEELTDRSEAPAQGTLERQEEVQRALDVLDPDERSVVLRVFYENQNFEQMARESGVAASTWKSRYYRARLKLAQALSDRGLEGQG